MIELTNDIKAQVIAPYLGQWCRTNTRHYPDPKKPSQYKKGLLKEIDTGMQDSFIGVLLEDETNMTNHSNYNPKECKLILKPLSRITREHAILVSRLELVNPDKVVEGESGGMLIFDKHNSSNVEFGNKLSDCWYDNGESYDNNVYRPLRFSCCQLLQHLGYDIEHYLLNGKTLQEAGLAVYE